MMDSMNEHYLSLKEKHGLGPDFMEIDKDNDGVVTFKEFKKYEDELSEFGLTDSWRFVLDKINQNRDGTLNYNDFIAAACDHKRMTSDENIRKAFALFDLNGDGQIDINEFKETLPAP